MRLEVGRLHCDDRIVGSVRLVESVAGKKLNVAVDGFGDRRVDPIFFAASHENLLVFFDLRRLLFADGTPHQISFPRGIARQSAEQLNDLFLIDNDPVGLGQNGGEQRVLVFDRLFTVHAPDEGWDVLQRAGPVKRDHGDNVLEGRGLHLGQHAAHALALHLEDPADFSAGEQGEGVTGSIPFVGNVFQRVDNVVPLLDQPCSLAHDRQGAEAEEVDLEQPDRLQDREFVLRNGAGHRGFAAAHDRGVVGQLAVRHDHGSRMDAGVAGDPFQLHGCVEQFFDPLFLGVKIDQLLAVKFVPLGQAVLDRHRLARDPWDQFGQIVHLGQIHPLGAANIPHGRLGFHPVEGRNLGDLGFAIFLDRITDHLLTLVVGVIQVEVRHGDAAGVEKALKDQVVLERVDAGDACAVGDQRASPRPPHIPPDVAAARKIAQIRHDQIIDIKAHGVDGAQLTLFAFLHLRLCRTRAVKPLHAFLGQLAQIGLIGVARRNRQVRQVVGGVFEVDLTHFGHPQRMLERTGWQIQQRLEGGLHLSPTFQKVAAVAHAHPIGLVDRDAGLDTEQHVVRATILCTHIMNIVGGDQIEPETGSPRNQRLVDLHQIGDGMLLQLDEKVLFAKELHVPAKTFVGLAFFALQQKLGHLSPQTAGAGDNPFSVGSQKIMVDPRLVVVAIELAVRSNFEQVAVANHVFGQQQQMIVFTVPLGVSAPHRPAPSGLVGFDPHQRTDASVTAGTEKLDGAMHGPMVGQRQRWLAQFDCLFDQIFDPAQPVEQ